MTHVFYVFSHITAQMVPLVIEHLALDLDDVIVLLDRSQTKEAIGIPVRIEEADLLPFENHWPDFWSNWHSIRRNAERIKLLTGDRDFIAYLPSPSFHKCQQIIHHPKCLRYFLFEEGLTSYCRPGIIPVVLDRPNAYRRFRSWIKVTTNGMGRVRPTDTDYPVWRKKYGGCFGSNALAFPEFPPPVVNLDKALYHAVVTPITRLVLFDKFSVFTREMQITYLEVIRHIVATEHSPGDHWGYKLHPGSSDWDWLNEAVEKIFRETLPPGTPCQRLPQRSCAENIGIAPGVTTYGYMSSCLFYIHQSGGKVSSFRSMIEARDTAFLGVWQRYFPPMLESLVGRYEVTNDTCQQSHPLRISDDR